MRYFVFHIGDWLAGTRWMTPQQRAIYLDLLLQYYDQEGPLQQEQCKCIADAYASAMQTDFQKVLHDHFVLEDDGYHNKRADEEIEAYRSKSSKRKQAASARWKKEKEPEKPAAQAAASDANAMQMQCKCNASAMLTNNQEPITNNQDKEDIAHASRAASLPCPTDVEPEAWDASNRIRRSKRVGAWTERAWSLAVKAGEQKGLSPSEMLDYCISRGWASFRAEYYAERPHVETPEEFGLRVAREMEADQRRNGNAAL